MSVTLPEFAGCPWPVDPSCDQDTWDGFDAPVQEYAVALASATLHRLSGYRVTNCPITVRPTNMGTACCYVPFSPGMVFDFTPIVLTDNGDGTATQVGGGVEGRWVNNCGCYTSSCTITLPRPVGKVLEVKVDGEVIPPTDYYQDVNQVIWRGDGACPWPVAQDVYLPDTEPGTLSVTYIQGRAPDRLAAVAVGALAIEYAKACTGSGRCALPKGVTAMTRQGVQFEINPGMFPDGFTGIQSVDAWIGLWRGPKSPTQPPRVWFPGMNRTGVTGG